MLINEDLVEEENEKYGQEKGCRNIASFYGVTGDNKVLGRSCMKYERQMGVIKEYKYPDQLMKIVKETVLLIKQTRDNAEAFVFDQGELTELDRFGDQIEDIQALALHSIKKGRYYTFNHIQSRCETILNCFKHSHAYSSFCSKTIQSSLSSNISYEIYKIYQETLDFKHHQKFQKISDEIHNAKEIQKEIELRDEN